MGYQYFHDVYHAMLILFRLQIHNHVSLHFEYIIVHFEYIIVHLLVVLVLYPLHLHI